MNFSKKKIVSPKDIKSSEEQELDCMSDDVVILTDPENNEIEPVRELVSC